MQPWGAWVALFCLLRFSAGVGPWRGSLAILAVAFGTNLLVWKGLLPLPSPFYQIVNMIGAIFLVAPILLHRSISPRLRGLTATLVYPCALVATQYLYSRISPSCTYGSIAYTQTFGPLLQVVALAGIWSLLFFLGWSASVAAHWSRGELGMRGVAVFGAIALALLGFGWARWRSSDPETRTVRVAGLVVGDFNYEFSHPIKDNLGAFRNAARETGQQMLKRSTQAAAAGARVVFWQEEALPLLKDEEDRFLAAAADCARTNHVFLGVALLVLTPEFPREWAENKIVWLDSDGKRVIGYAKAHPTPSEPVTPGPERVKSTVFDDGRLASVICFDMDFPAFLRQAGAQQVDLLCVPANDWREIAPYHTRITAFRAIEQGLSVVRATGNGLSAAYDPCGRELASLTCFDNAEGRLLAEVPLRRRRTLYTAVGDAGVGVCAVGLAVLTLMAFRRGRREPVADFGMQNDDVKSLNHETK
jgi:apolipoprotein N-acyltransferase